MDDNNPVLLFHILNSLLPTYLRMSTPLSPITDSFILITETDICNAIPSNLMHNNLNVRQFVHTMNETCVGGIFDTIIGGVMNQCADSNYALLNIPVLACDWKEGKKFIWGTSISCNGHTFRIHWLNSRLPPDPKTRSPAQPRSLIEAAKLQVKKKKKKSAEIPIGDIHEKSVLITVDEGEVIFSTFIHILTLITFI